LLSSPVGCGPPFCELLGGLTVARAFGHICL